MALKVNIKPSEAVHTQYMGPTNTHGSRIKGTLIGGKSVTVPYDYALSATDNHAKVASALLKTKNLACTDDRKAGYLWSKR